MKVKKYKVRIKNLVYQNGMEETKIVFSIDLKERLGTSRFDISVSDDKVMFLPNDTGAFLAREIVEVRSLKLVKNLRAFNGEYLAIVKGDNILYVQLSDCIGFQHIGKKRADRMTAEPEPKPIAKPVYKNPYLQSTAQEATLRNIIYAQDARIVQLNKDIDEAEKLLAELSAERDNLVGIQTRAEELITLLGGKK